MPIIKLRRIENRALTYDEIDDNFQSLNEGIENINIRTVEANDELPAILIRQSGAGDALRVEDKSSPDTTPFVIDNSGNVGVGVSSPTAKLDVDGDIKGTWAGDAVSVNVGGTGANTAELARDNLNVPARDGTDATGEWNIDITGNSATADSSSEISNAGGWSVTPNGINLIFSYNGVDLGKLDSSGNLTVLGDVTGFGTI